MTPQRVFVATMIFFGLCFGMVPAAHAITDCNAACQGGKKPCTLKCNLSNGFVTTCGEIGPCTKVKKQQKTSHKKTSSNQKTQQDQKN
jgi:hypothetical protein